MRTCPCTSHGAVSLRHRITADRLLSSHAYSSTAKSCRSQMRSKRHSVTAASNEAIVLVDHGSRRPEANNMLEVFADVYRATSKRSFVRTAHMELASPSIPDAIAECVAGGASTVIIAPFFLSRGRHITEDIPAIVQAAAEDHPSIRLVVADPLGTDELLAQLIEKRVQHARLGSTQ